MGAGDGSRRCEADRFALRRTVGAAGPARSTSIAGTSPLRASVSGPAPSSVGFNLPSTLEGSLLS